MVEYPKINDSIKDNVNFPPILSNEFQKNDLSDISPCLKEKNVKSASVFSISIPPQLDLEIKAKIPEKPQGMNELEEKNEFSEFGKGKITSKKSLNIDGWGKKIEEYFQKLSKNDPEKFPEISEKINNFYLAVFL